VLVCFARHGSSLSDGPFRTCSSVFRTRCIDELIVPSRTHLSRYKPTGRFARVSQERPEGHLW